MPCTANCLNSFLLKPHPLWSRGQPLLRQRQPLEPVSALCVITASRSHSLLAPSRPHGITPPANSFFSTSCSASSCQPSRVANLATAPSPNPTDCWPTQNTSLRCHRRTTVLSDLRK